MHRSLKVRASEPDASGDVASGIVGDEPGEVGRAQGAKALVLYLEGSGEPLQALSRGGMITASSVLGATWSLLSWNQL